MPWFITLAQTKASAEWRHFYLVPGLARSLVGLNNQVVGLVHGLVFPEFLLLPVAAAVRRASHPVIQGGYQSPDS